MGSPSSPSEDPAAIRLRKRQQADLIRLDEEENTRIRRIMRAGRGMRAFKGSPDMRLQRGNFTGGRASTLPPGYDPVRAAEPSSGFKAWARTNGAGTKSGRRLLRRTGG